MMMATKKSEKELILDYIQSVAVPVDYSLFKLIYNVYVDTSYVNHGRRGFESIVVKLQGIGEVEISSSNDERALSAWNEMQDMGVSDDVALAAIIRLLISVNLHLTLPQSFKKWFKDDASLADVLVFACSKAKVERNKMLGGLSFDLDYLLKLSEEITEHRDGV